MDWTVAGWQIIHTYIHIERDISIAQGGILFNGFILTEQPCLSWTSERKARKGKERWTMIRDHDDALLLACLWTFGFGICWIFGIFWVDFRAFKRAVWSRFAFAACELDTPSFSFLAFRLISPVFGELDNGMERNV